MNNWLVNPTGKTDAWIPVDLLQEHMNFWIKVSRSAIVTLSDYLLAVLTLHTDYIQSSREQCIVGMAAEHISVHLPA